MENKNVEMIDVENYQFSYEKNYDEHDGGFKRLKMDNMLSLDLNKGFNYILQSHKTGTYFPLLWDESESKEDFHSFISKSVIDVFEAKRNDPYGNLYILYDSNGETSISFDTINYDLIDFDEDEEGDEEDTKE